MILVVWQHCHTYYTTLETGEYYLESFRMPLFFCVSGMFFKQYSSFTEFTKRKINSLLIPFLFFYSIFSVLVPNALYCIGYEGLRQSSKLGVSSLFNFIFEKKYSNNPVWFLLALFWLNFLFYALYWLVSRISIRYKTPILLILCLMCGAFGFILGANHFIVWANIDNALTACPYFCLGFILNKETRILYERNSKKLLIAIFGGGLFYIYLFSPGLGYLQNTFPLDSFFSVYSCGIIGTVSILALSRAINKSIPMKFYGENTLIILCMQMPIIQAVNLILKHLGTSGYMGFFMTFFVVLILLIPVIFIFNNYLPWFTGKRALF